MKDKYYFTSESVTCGHPDKMCDQISDAILDACLKQDPNSRVACETATKTGMIVLLGEITTNAKIDYQKIVRDTIKEIGYIDSSCGFDYKTCSVLVAIQEQSNDIKMGVDISDKIVGAGDQGIMFGYAVNETESFMPLSIDLANKLAFMIEKLRKENVLNYLKPDGKTQVTVEYENGLIKRIDTVVISVQHRDDVSLSKIRKDMIEFVVKKVIPNTLLDENTKYYINPTGRFVIGGPQADAGLTGRKIIVDTYGGHGACGGGAFSGKDATKVDRSGAYIARHIAKNIVASRIADRCLVQLSYAIGIAEPVSVFVDCYGTNKVDILKIKDKILEEYDLTPLGIINYLKLRNPIFRKTACYGHFGRENENFAWENLDKVFLFAKLIEKK